jgi:hypothetical protein
VATDPFERSAPAGFFVPEEGAGRMANHLTPEELSKELKIDRQEVIRVCMQEGVPIYHGKIDKHLFQAQLAAVSGAESTIPHH